MFPTLRTGRPMDIKYALVIILTAFSGSVSAEDSGFGFVKHNPDGQTYSIQPRKFQSTKSFQSSSLRIMEQFGIAVVGKNASGNGVSAVEIEGHAITISTCLSHEGVHLFSRKNGSINGHLYLSLEYDVEPTSNSCETNTHESVPTDVSSYIKNRNNCDALRGDIPERDPTDPKHLDRVISDINKYCEGTDQQLKQLKEKYSGSKNVEKLLSTYEESIEADMSF